MTNEFNFDSWQAKMVALEIANEVGRAILKSLSKEPKTASQIAKALSIPLPTILFHLSRLEESGIVSSKKALGKRLREVKVYSVSSTDIVFRIGDEKDG
ncbi:MAG: winged helix-turn-helix domain-containing protein [Candidatus Thermoplasmatota archaeon]|nr:winged helix-turn-helix domain-containing protein [Candidatus Thermoplasmatota archaeon]MBU4071749.1 winged helix-turn-helix domain-containing protein [Candidatus Thermoplasmatota archaeon]